jgi:hypothetical protein
MTVQLLFGTGVAFGFVAWPVVTAVYIWPKSQIRSRIDAPRAAAGSARIAERVRASGGGVECVAAPATRRAADRANRTCALSAARERYQEGLHGGLLHLLTSVAVRGEPDIVGA